MKIFSILIGSFLGLQLQAMTVTEFNFLSGLLHSGKVADKMDCKIQAREIKEERKFSDTTKIVEYIKLDFTTSQLGPRSTTVSIPSMAKISKSFKTHEDWGPVEEMKIELDDTLNSNLIISHTGDRIVFFEISNTLSIYLCGVKLGK